MAQFLHRYMQYRRVGFGRLAAFHFAWLVTGAGARPAIVRLPGR
jgi:hypothetical protein